MGGACFRMATWHIRCADLRGTGMEGGGAIPPSRRCSNTSAYCYSYLYADTIADSDPDANAHRDQIANTNKNIIFDQYAIIPFARNEAKQYTLCSSLALPEQVCVLCVKTFTKEIYMTQPSFQDHYPDVFAHCYGC